MRIPRRSALLAAVAAPTAACSVLDRDPAPTTPRPRIDCEGGAPDSESPAAERVINPRSVCLNGDGTELAALHGDHIVVWSTADGTITRKSGTNRQPASNSGALAWDPRRDVISRDICAAQVELLDAHDFSSSGTLTGHETVPAVPVTLGIEQIAHSPDGEIIATSGVDGTLRIWGGTDRVERLELDLEDTHVTGSWLNFSADSRYLAVAGGGAPYVQILHIGTGTFRTLKDAEFANGGGWSPDGAAFLGEADGRLLHLFDGATFEPVDGAEGPSDTTAPIWTSDGAHVISLDQNSTEIVIWAVDSGDVRSVETGTEGFLLHPSSDPHRIYLVSSEHGITEWDLTTDEAVREFELPVWGG